MKILHENQWGGRGLAIPQAATGSGQSEWLRLFCGNEDTKEGPRQTANTHARKSPESRPWSRIRPAIRIEDSGTSAGMNDSHCVDPRYDADFCPG